MEISTSLSIPALLLVASLTLSSPSTSGYEGSLPLPLTYHSDSILQTTSTNQIAEKYVLTSYKQNAQSKAMRLFGDQTYFSDEERATYQAVLAEKSERVGINIFNLF